jgi:hypothetical protein
MVLIVSDCLVDQELGLRKCRRYVRHTYTIKSCGLILVGAYLTNVIELLII